MSQDHPSCVVADGKLIGFFSMPSTPFVWLGFRDNQVDTPISHFNGSTGYYGTNRKYLFHRLVVSAAREFRTVEDINPQAGMSDELVQLFDKYGIVFAVELSEQLAYETGRLSGQKNSLRNVRLFDVGDVWRVWKSFMRLLECWLDTYGHSAPVKPSAVEVLLMRDLMLQFVDIMPKQYLADSGWNPSWVLMLKHMFTPPEIRAIIPPNVLEVRDELMSTLGNYHHFW